VLPLDRKGLCFQSFSGIILAGERSRKSVDELDHRRIEGPQVASFERGRAARHRLGRVRFYVPGKCWKREMLAANSLP
jgi:hypothetical protein